MVGRELIQPYTLLACLILVFSRQGFAFFVKDYVDGLVVGIGERDLEGFHALFFFHVGGLDGQVFVGRGQCLFDGLWQRVGLDGLKGSSLMQAAI